MNGTIYVAFGQPALREMRRSAAGLWQHADLDVAVIAPTGTALDLDGAQLIPFDQPGPGARWAKLNCDLLAPPAWRHILYLDADTETVAPVPYLFDVLEDGWDMAICVNPDRYHLARHMGRPDSQEETRVTLEQIGSDELIQYQGGVFAFRRNKRTAEFFRSWHEEWQIWGKRDQGALLRAMHKNPLRLWLLGNEWNLSDRYLPEERSAGIVHRQTMARRWEGIVNERLDSPEAWGAVRKWEERQV